MSTVVEIERAVEALSPEQLAAFRACFAAFDAAVRERKLAEDSAAGRLEALAHEALEDLSQRRCADL